MKTKLLVAVLITGIGFWVYRPDNGGFYPQGSFVNFKDCDAVRTWLASIQPLSAAANNKMAAILPNKLTPTATPAWANTAAAVPNALVVSPACYYMN